MTSILRLSATDVALDSALNFIGFLEQPSERYFWMQPADWTNAKDEIWLERDDQGWGGKGGEWSVALTRNSFVVNTSELPWMECDAIVIDFVIDDQTYGALVTALKRVMVDCPSDLDIRE